jgi:hypothetical protein
MSGLSRIFSYFVVFLSVLVAALSIGGVLFSYQRNGTSGILAFLFLLLFSILSAWHFVKKAKGSVDNSPSIDHPAATQTGIEVMADKEIKKEVGRMTNDGIGKTRIFQDLVSRGAKEKVAAYYVASYPNEHIVFEQEGKVKLLITVMFIQAFLAFFVGYIMGMQVQHPWIIGIMFATIPLLFVWGFYKQSVVAYNTYFLIAIAQVPKIVRGFSETPIETSIGLAISLGTLWLVLYIRSKLFPDFTWFTPKKVKGRYVFSS